MKFQIKWETEDWIQPICRRCDFYISHGEYCFLGYSLTVVNHSKYNIKNYGPYKPMDQIGCPGPGIYNLTKE